MTVYDLNLNLHEIEQLIAFSKKPSTWPGDTISHHTANKLIDKQLAKRVKGNFVITTQGVEYINKIKRFLQ